MVSSLLWLRRLIGREGTRRVFRREKMVVPSGTAALILTVPKPMTAVEEPAVRRDRIYSSGEEIHNDMS